MWSLSNNCKTVLIYFLMITLTFSCLEPACISVSIRQYLQFANIRNSRTDCLWPSVSKSSSSWFNGCQIRTEQFIKTGFYPCPSSKLSIVPTSRGEGEWIECRAIIILWIRLQQSSNNRTEQSAVNWGLSASHHLCSCLDLQFIVPSMGKIERHNSV